MTFMPQHHHLDTLFLSQHSAKNSKYPPQQTAQQMPLNTSFMGRCDLHKGSDSHISNAHAEMLHLIGFSPNSCRSNKRPEASVTIQVHLLIQSSPVWDLLDITDHNSQNSQRVMLPGFSGSCITHTWKTSDMLQTCSAFICHRQIDTCFETSVSKNGKNNMLSNICEGFP